MMLRAVTLAVVVTCAALLSGSALAGPQDAVDQFAEGNALLAQADFEAALKAYTAAAQADPDNSEYRMQATLVRRVIKIRQTLDELKDDPKWLTTAKALYTFYVDNKVHGEALAIATQINAQEGSPESAALLARARLAQGMNAAAAEGLRSVAPDKVNAELRVLLGLALGRQGQTAAARELLTKIEEPTPTGCSYLYDLACLHALAGDRDQAVKVLTAYLENTPPSRLEAARQRVRKSNDLAALRNHSGFATALAVQSKVAESKCSSGPSCGECPHRAKCGNSGKTGCKGRAKQGQNKP